MSGLDKLATFFNKMNNASDDEVLEFNINSDTEYRVSTHRQSGGASGETLSSSVPSDAPAVDVTTVKTQTCYVVVPDSVYNNNGAKLKWFTYGQVHEDLKDKMPVLFTEEDATKLANKLKNYIDEKGTLHGEQKCPYPVGGFVIAECEISDGTVQDVAEKDLFSGGGKRNYSVINKSNADLVTYTIGGGKHGFVNSEGINKLQIKKVKYGIKLDILPHLRSLLLNNTDMDNESLTTLNNAWKNNADTYTELPNQSGGSYLAEKRKYLQMKADARKRGLI